MTGTAAQTNELPLLHTYIKNLCCPSPNSKVKNALANLGREAQGRSERNPVHESSKVDHFWSTGPRLCWPLALLIGNFGFLHVFFQFFRILWPQSKIRCKMIVVLGVTEPVLLHQKHLKNWKCLELLGSKMILSFFGEAKGQFSGFQGPIGTHFKLASGRVLYRPGTNRWVKQSSSLIPFHKSSLMALHQGMTFSKTWDPNSPKLYLPLMLSCTIFVTSRSCNSTYYPPGKRILYISPPKREVWKIIIIISKVPAGIGYVSFFGG